MAITRTVYYGQEAKITANGTSYYFPVISASCDSTRPIENVPEFGKFQSDNIVQNTPSTCRSSFKSYLVASTSLPTVVNNLKIDAKNGAGTVISVTPGGFEMTGICTNFSVDSSVGALATCSFAFQGMGPLLYHPITGTPTDQPTMPSSINPINSTQVLGAFLSVGCATSFKFSLDMPAQTITTAGLQLTGTYADQNWKIVSQPPFKSTLSMEGYGLDISASGNLEAQKGQTFALGLDEADRYLGISLLNPVITALAFSNAAGTSNSIYSFTIEGTDASFAASSP